MDGVLVAVRNTTVAPEKEPGQEAGQGSTAERELAAASAGKRGVRPPSRLSPVINYTLHRLSSLLNWQVRAHGRGRLGAGCTLATRFVTLARTRHTCMSQCACSTLAAQFVAPAPSLHTCTRAPLPPVQVLGVRVQSLPKDFHSSVKLSVAGVNILLLTKALQPHEVSGRTPSGAPQQPPPPPSLPSAAVKSPSFAYMRGRRAAHSPRGHTRLTARPQGQQPKPAPHVPPPPATAAEGGAAALPALAQGWDASFYLVKQVRRAGRGRLVARPLRGAVAAHAAYGRRVPCLLWAMRVLPTAQSLAAAALSCCCCCCCLAARQVPEVVLGAAADAGGCTWSPAGKARHQSDTHECVCCYVQWGVDVDLLLCTHLPKTTSDEQAQQDALKPLALVVAGSFGVRSKVGLGMQQGAATGLVACPACPPSWCVCSSSSRLSRALRCPLP